MRRSILTIRDILPKSGDMPEDLEGVVATSIRLSHVDGEAGRLTIAGYAVEELAPYASFEEVAYLLLHGRLPEPSERVGFTQDLAGRRALSPTVLEVLREAAATQALPIDALRMAAALLSLGREENPVDDALTAIASFPTIVGAYWRARNGDPPVAVRSDLPHAAHYLHQVFGAEPSAERARALETYLNTVCDHGLNASTFAARVIVSTRSDVISAITGAVGALKGPLHGGAPGPALDMVFEIGTPERAEIVIRAKLDRGERLMGLDIASTECVTRARMSSPELPSASTRAAVINVSMSLRSRSKPRRCVCSVNASRTGDLRPMSSSTRRSCCTVWDCRPDCSRRRSPLDASSAGRHTAWNNFATAG